MLRRLPTRLRSSAGLVASASAKKLTPTSTHGAAAVKAPHLDSSSPVVYPWIAPQTPCDEYAARLKQIQALPLSYSTWDEKIPLLTKAPLKNQKTLVLDLDETLGSGGNPWIHRNGAEEFMKTAFALYDVVIWAGGLPPDVRTKDVEDQVKSLGVFDKLRHPILAVWTDWCLNGDVKDLKLLGRPLDQVLLIDDDSRHVALQPRLQWKIKAWCGDSADDVLLSQGVPLLHAVAAAKTVQHVMDPFLASDPAAVQWIMATEQERLDIDKKQPM
jgi:hypothetical protein